MRPDLPVVPVLFGPTASGKTGALFRLFGSGGLCSRKAEVVSADSMQVYRGMNIGTAKPSAPEMARLPHHLVDIRDPGEQFNAGDFVHLAVNAIDEIAGRGVLPVVCGGTVFICGTLSWGFRKRRLPMRTAIGIQTVTSHEGGEGLVVIDAVTGEGRRLIQIFPRLNYAQLPRDDIGANETITLVRPR